GGLRSRPLLPAGRRPSGSARRARRYEDAEELDALSDRAGAPLLGVALPVRLAFAITDPPTMRGRRSGRAQDAPVGELGQRSNLKPTRKSPWEASGRHMSDEGSSR